MPRSRRAPSGEVLAERIKGHEELRRQQELWERDRRAEDRSDRAKKDEELNGVRLQLHEQAGTFASKDLLSSIEKSLDAKVDAIEHTLAGKIDVVERGFDAKLDTAFDRLNREGTEGYRESEAARIGREEATKEILDTVRENGQNTQQNRRWLIGLLAVVILGILANSITVILYVVDHLH